MTAFAEPVRTWFAHAFRQPTEAQTRAWPPILAGESTLLLAPTGSGKTLAAFLAGINRLMTAPVPARNERCRLLYVSPLKALAVDIERNLRAPLAGIAALAHEQCAPLHLPTLAIRTGDTPAADRARMARTPPDILITTPESLYLLLTSAAAAILATVETVIIDEIHALAATKRGVHLLLSLERLEELRRRRDAHARPVQRLGLSATQRPLDEIARLLGGGEIRQPGHLTGKPQPDRGKEPFHGVAPVSDPGEWLPRPVTVIDAGRKKTLELTVEMPIEELAASSTGLGSAPNPAHAADIDHSIWPSIYPRLLELVRAHRSTLIFANSRRLAERLASALNDLAGVELALAHHGSLARERRQEIERRLKAGDLPAIVATSSLELGIDMGAIDLVVQIEAPPSVTSGLQRIGRAGHQVGAVSQGVIFPKYRGDLLACAAATQLMHESRVETTRYPRNPLDVLAQQLVAMCAMRPTRVDDLYALVRRATPFAELPRPAFEGVLDMLSGRYPSDEFAGLRPRLVWDRVGGVVRAREGARHLAVVNAGTIPDRGLYGVFLAGADRRRSRRVGELDEEMVFESRVGDVFLLGASSWRIEEITHDRVLVSPAPGEPGKTPFWHGDRPGRPLEFGRAIGQLVRALNAAPAAEARRLLREAHGLADQAADNLLAYLDDQARATSHLPSDQTVVIERFLDELGDWRVCVLSPFGAPVHAPWATAVQARWQERTAGQIDALWSDDGIVFRLPEADRPPPSEWFLPEPDRAEDLVTRGLGSTTLFAARFRENAARALLLPRRRPGRRTPLWAQRKRGADLLRVAARYSAFPLLLETYRECLRDVFDLPGLVELLRQIDRRELRVVTVDSRTPSPFAAALLFSYVANFIYDGDAPLAERRAQVLSLDQTQLRELLGEAELRELLDGETIRALEARLQRREGPPIRHADDLHDLLRALGDLSQAEMAERITCGDPAPPPAATTVADWLGQLVRERRAVPVTIGGETRFIAVEDAARYRDGAGVVLPSTMPAALLETAADPIGDLVARYARTHGPFRAEAVAARLGVSIEAVRSALQRLAAGERVCEGEFLPGGTTREWCETEVLRSLKRQSLARLRRQVEPVEPDVFARFLAEWQGVRHPGAAAETLLAVVEQLQATPILASALESDILPTRIADYLPGDLDASCAAGEVVWRGVESLGPEDGRIALYLSSQYRLLAGPAQPAGGELAASVRQLLTQRGALFFADLLAETGAFSVELLSALWAMVWAGEVTNDTLMPLRSLIGEPPPAKQRHRPHRRCPQPRATLPGSEGRWSLLPRTRAVEPDPSDTERRTALAHQLLARYGVLTREAVLAEGMPGGFATVYEVLKAMADRGQVRQGYFVAGLGATQFALPGAEERLRALRRKPETPQTLTLAAADPANPYGAALPWPQRSGETLAQAAARVPPGPVPPPPGDPPLDPIALDARVGSEERKDPAGIGIGARAQRAAGARVILVDGALRAWIPRSENNLLTFLPLDEPERSQFAAIIAQALSALVTRGLRRACLIPLVDGQPVERSFLAPFLIEAGFTAGSRGYLRRRGP
ncbi:MAG: DEAD/DEAH box helicase [Verrucomicrobia bacterium]|nr:DEAD/DEAH box helicase [Verrucomicrobiota bacterium]